MCDFPYLVHLFHFLIICWSSFDFICTQTHSSLLLVICFGLRNLRFRMNPLFPLTDVAEINLDVTNASVVIPYVIPAVLHNMLMMGFPRLHCSLKLFYWSTCFSRMFVFLSLLVCNITFFYRISVCNTVNLNESAVFLPN